MDKDRQDKQDIIDEDLYETFDEDELLELVEEARLQALAKAAEREASKKKPAFPKWIFWLIALSLLMNVLALLPQTFSIPALDFLMTSASLSTSESIKELKPAVVVVETESSKGTGFSINSKGDIVTNYHVIEGGEEITIAFPKRGLYRGELVQSFPEVDLAIVAIGEKDMPYVELASQFEEPATSQVRFIGNPLRFNGIANEGRIVDWVYVQSKDEPVLILDAPVYRGNSGSPVFNEAKEVIGVIFATIDHEVHGRVGVFVPIDYLLDRMEMN